MRTWPRTTLPLVIALALVVALALLFAACGPSGNSAVAYNEPPATPPSELALTLRKEATDLLARPELDLKEVTVQHCLIAVRNKGPFADKPALSHRDAEEKAAVLFHDARKGADFRLIVLRNTYDHIFSEAEPGVLHMFRPDDPKSMPTERTKLDRDKNQYYRDELTRWFSMASWRLNVGEVGVIEKSGENSPYGFHIIKRLK